MEMNSLLDTTNLVSPIRDTIVLYDTLPPANLIMPETPHEKTIHTGQYTKIYPTQQAQDKSITVSQPESPQVFYYLFESFTEPFIPPQVNSLFPTIKSDSVQWDIVPVPVLINHNISTSRQHGNSYLQYIECPKEENTLSAVPIFPFWAIYLVLFSFTVITLLKIFHSRFFALIINSVLSLKETLLVYVKKNSITQITFLVLHLLFALNLGLFLFLTGTYFNLLPPFPDFLSFVILSAGIYLIYQIKFFILNFLGFLFDQVKTSTEYIHSISVYNNFLGVLLIPLTAGIAIFDENFIVYFIYTGFFLIFLLYFFIIIRGAKIILSKGFSIFYMFLYLCALEILPLLIFYTLLQA